MRIFIQFADTPACNTLCLVLSQKQISFKCSLQNYKNQQFLLDQGFPQDCIIPETELYNDAFTEQLNKTDIFVITYYDLRFAMRILDFVQQTAMDKFVLCLSPHLSWIDGSSNLKSSKQYKTIRSTFYNNRLIENKLLQLITREQTNARRLCTAIITHGIIIDNFAPAQNPFIDLVQFVRSFKVFPMFGNHSIPCTSGIRVASHAFQLIDQYQQSHKIFKLAENQLIIDQNIDLTNIKTAINKALFGLQHIFPEPVIDPKDQKNRPKSNKGSPNRASIAAPSEQLVTKEPKSREIRSLDINYETYYLNVTIQNLFVLQNIETLNVEQYQEVFIQTVFPETSFKLLANPCVLEVEYENNFNTDDFSAFLNFQESDDPIINKVQMVLMESQTSLLPQTFKTLLPYIQLCASKSLQHQDYFLLGSELLNQQLQKRNLLLSNLRDTVEFSPKSVFVWISQLPEAAKTGDFWYDFVPELPVAVEEVKDPKAKQPAAKKGEIIERRCDKVAAAVRFILSRGINQDSNFEDLINDTYIQFMKEYATYLNNYQKFNTQLSKEKSESKLQVKDERGKGKDTPLDQPPQCVSYQCFIISCLIYLEFQGPLKNYLMTGFQEHKLGVEVFKQLQQVNLADYIINYCNNSDFVNLLDQKKGNIAIPKGMISLQSSVLASCPAPQDWFGKPSVFSIGFQDYRIIDGIVINPIVEEILKNPETLLQQRDDCYQQYKVLADYLLTTGLITKSNAKIDQKQAILDLNSSYHNISLYHLPKIVDVSSLFIDQPQLERAYRFEFSATLIHKQTQQSSLGKNEKNPKDPKGIALSPIEQERKYIFDHIDFSRLSDKEFLRFLQSCNNITFLLDEPFEEIFYLTEIRSRYGVEALRQLLSFPIAQELIIQQQCSNNLVSKLVHSKVISTPTLEKIPEPTKIKKDEKKDLDKKQQSIVQKQEEIIPVQEIQIAILPEIQPTLLSLLNIPKESIPKDCRAEVLEFVFKFGEICGIDLQNAVNEREKLKQLKEQKVQQKYINQQLTSGLSDLSVQQLSKNNSFEEQQSAHHDSEKESEEELSDQLQNTVQYGALEDAMQYFNDNKIGDILAKALSDLMIGQAANMVDDPIEFLSELIQNVRLYEEEKVQETAMIDGSNLGQNTADILMGIEENTANIHHEASQNNEQPDQASLQLTQETNE